MTRVQHGDRDAFASLFQQTHQKLHGRVLRIVRDEGIADDIVVETFAKAWEAKDRFDAERGSVLNWLRVLACRLAIDTVRRQVARPGDRALEGEQFEHTPSSAPGPSESSSSLEEQDRIQRAVQELPQNQRLVIEAAFFGGLSHSQIAEHLGEALGTVKSRIRGGLITLRRALEAGDRLGSGEVGQS